MARKVFTDEEIEMLRKNPYTYVVTPKMIKFTQEFKELFWKEHQNDVKPGKIFEKYGYPTKVLGSKRIWGISRLIREQFYSEDDLQKGKRQKKEDISVSKDEFRKIQNELKFIRQEIEFFKKIYSIRNSRR